MKLIVVGLAIAVLAGCASSSNTVASSTKTAAGPIAAASQQGTSSMQLGNFSVSLTVKNLQASKAFYEKLGFTHKGGDGKKWLILKNNTAVIGLFEGMFDKNMLTFNPGWDRDANTLPHFDDVRAIQETLRSRGIEIKTEADPASKGPAHIVIIDPDGNPILIDQHVPKPSK